MGEGIFKMPEKEDCMGYVLEGERYRIDLSPLAEEKRPPRPFVLAEEMDGQHHRVVATQVHDELQLCVEIPEGCDAMGNTRWDKEPDHSVAMGVIEDVSAQLAKALAGFLRSKVG